jgi:hypothetical protein
MAEIGLAQFATIALQVGQAALPAYRRKFAKHQYTQPLRSSTVSVTISTFTKPCRPRAPFRPSGVADSGRTSPDASGFPDAPVQPTCTERKSHLHR